MNSLFNLELVLPDYNRKWIVNLTQWLFSTLWFIPKFDYEPYLESYFVNKITKSKKIFLIVIDGLWDDFFNRNSVNLTKYKMDTLISCFPSTTAVANSNFYCWYPWLQTWIPSWYFFEKELWTIICPIKFRTKLWKNLWDLWIEPNQLYDISEPDFSGIKISRMFPSDYKWTIFNSQLSGRHIWYEDIFSDFFWKLLFESQKQTSEWSIEFVSVYRPYLDLYGHDYWINSDVTIDLYNKFEEWLLEIIKNKHEDSMFIITSDHWMVDSWDKMINLYKDKIFSSLIKWHPWGENRYLFVSVDTKDRNKFEDHLQKKYWDKLDVFRNWEDVSLFWKWKAHKEFNSRIQDYTLVWKNDASFEYTKFKLPKKDKIWVHWWLSGEEMYVPLLIA